MPVLHWLATAFRTYILHSEHGNGYQGGAGGPGGLWIAQLGAWWTIACQLVRRHNCDEHRCLRVGTHRSQLDKHVRCRRHHNAHKTHPNYVDAKDDRH